MSKIVKSRFDEIFSEAKGKKIAIVGDVMLDRYFWGKVSRISPEAPVPVVDLEREDFHLGGAANAAANLVSLGLKPLLCGAIGGDEMGGEFVRIANVLNINTGGIYIDKNRSTTVKTRIFGNNQQLLRLDSESKNSISKSCEEFILSFLEKNNDISALIFADYNKGVLSVELIGKIINHCRKRNIPVLVDPKSDNFFEYKNVAMFKPNRREAEDGLGFSLDSDEDIQRAGRELLEKLNCENVLLTLGAKGMMLFEKNGNICKIETKARHVADVSGAGDTAIATFSAVIAGGGSHSEAMEISNSASGIVCEKPGIVSAGLNKLSEYFSR
jgi:D-glycero-beta-D-manno-heptose-7-phosphate kinase